MERLLALASRNQQFLSHDLYAGVVRQLQVVDAGHDWGEEVVWILRRLKRLPHNRQRWVQAPETCRARATAGERGAELQYKHIRVYLIKSHMSGSLNGVRVCMMRLTSDGQSWASCDKLQKESLLLSIEAAQHLKQEPNCTAAKTGWNGWEKLLCYYSDQKYSSALQWW